MLELIEVHTSRLVTGEPDPVASVTWINPQHIVRIDLCDSRGEHDTGELAMILELTNGNELYVPIASEWAADVHQAVAQAVRDLLMGGGSLPLAAFEIE